MNDYDYFRKVQHNEQNEAVSKVEFNKANTPPWDILNQILNKHNIDFYFQALDDKDFSPDVHIRFNLIKKSTEKIIDFNGLSSGEKIIIGLVMKLFTSQYYKDNLQFPDLLVLDEPDAHLHPEMSKLLLDVLQDTFVKEFNLKVIISTHSPSTIALCDEDSIYQLKNESESSLKKISKDEALKMLTGFIPTLSIDYKSHRQVFVESPTDAYYYQSLANKHLQVKKLIHKLYFISYGFGEGNCSQVYELVKAMRNSGNTTSFGVVDWDKSDTSKGNVPKNYVFVHGYNERYSIENFVLDPIYIAVLFMDMKGACNIYQAIKRDETYNEFSIGDESKEFLQSVANWYFENIYNVFPVYRNKNEISEIVYLNGKKIKVPTWYLTSNGHKVLVPMIKKVFKVLDTNRFSNESDLLETLVLISAKCYPLVPKASIDTIEAIANG